MNQTNGTHANDGGGSRAADLVVVALIGAAIATAVSLLLAPQSGKATRRWLTDETRKVKEKSADLFEHGKRAAHLGTQGDNESRPSVTGSDA